jgi:elongation factor Ts
MVRIETEHLRALRERTGAGMLDCKRALQDAGGDIEKAIVSLREKGLAEAAKKTGRTTAEGLVWSYIHHDGRVGVMLELSCETDFVARTEEFRELANELCMHIAMCAPQYLVPEQVPEAVLEQEKRIYRTQAEQEGKPEKVLDKIVEGRVRKFYSQVCLLQQPWVRDDKIAIEELIKRTVAKLGENVRVKRFARFKIGEDTQAADA